MAGLAAAFNGLRTIMDRRSILDGVARGSGATRATAFVATRQITPQGLGLLCGPIDEGVDCLAADGPQPRFIPRFQPTGDLFGALSRVPAQVLPAVPMATPVDPIFTAIERDRIAFVAFAASLSKTDERKAARKKVAKSHKPMRTLTKPPAASGTMLLVNLRMTAFGVRGRRAVLPLAEPSRE